MNSNSVLILLINFITVLCFKTNFNDLSRYLDEEKSIIDSFDEYLSSEKNRIFRLRQTYQNFRQQNTIALKDKELFLSHPNDVYFLIKRIGVEWKTNEEKLESNKTAKNNLIFILNDIDTSKYNFTETVEAYEKLINYYEQNITFAANGVLEFKTSSGEQNFFKSISNQTFNAFDCYSMGKQSFNNKDYLSAVLWFEEGLKREDNEEFPFKKSMINILKSIDKKNTIKWNKNEFVHGQKLEETIDHDSNSFGAGLNLKNDKLCRGNKLMNISYESKLKCFYLNTTLRPYLRLTRIRVEELFKRPQIVLIHNFLSETEAKTLKNIAKNKLTPSKVFVGTGGDTAFNYDSRISSRLFLTDFNHSLVKTIDRRISEITGFNSEISKDIIGVVRYNVGGKFKMHRHAFGKVITCIIYLSDTVVGGATSFPIYNVSVFPQKYSVLLFYDLLSSGENDPDMYHSGCPVLYGQKWTTVKQFRIEAQSLDKCHANIYEPRSLQVV